MYERREEENYVSPAFGDIAREMDERAKERIFPRKKLPKITLFRLRLVFSPLNPVSRGETRLVRRPSFTDRHHRFRTEATRNGVDGTKR